MRTVTITLPDYFDGVRLDRGREPGKATDVKCEFTSEELDREADLSERDQMLLSTGRVDDEIMAAVQQRIDAARRLKYGRLMEWRK